MEISHWRSGFRLGLALLVVALASAVPAEETGVYIEHIELGEAEATRLLLAGEDPVALRVAIGEHLEAGRAKVIDVAYLLARVGDTSKAESIIEYLYPTEWDPAEVIREIRVDVAEGSDFKTPANPTAFDVRNLGNTLEFRASRKPGGPMQMELEHSLVRLSRLRQFGADELGIFQPQFERQQLEASTTCTHRRPILLGVYAPRAAGRRDRRVFAFATPIIKNHTPAEVLESPDLDYDPFGDEPPDPEKVARGSVLGVSVGVEYIEVDQSHLTDLLDGVPHALGEPSEVREKAGRLLAAGEAKLLASGTLKTTLGQRAKIEPVHEFIYPTEYDPPEIVGKLNAKILAGDPPLKTGVNPTAFDVRNLGMTIEAKAHLLHIGGVEMLDLNIAPELVGLARRIAWGREVAQSKHPIFGNEACAARLHLMPGDEALAAIITPREIAAGAPDGDRRILIIVWADVARAK